jgi:acetyl-CoA synthetase
MANDANAASMNIDSILQENRVFPPSAEFSAKAHIKSMAEYERICAEAKADPEGFWGKVAKELHVGQGAGMGCALGKVVCGRQDQHQL